MKAAEPQKATLSEFVVYYAIHQVLVSLIKKDKMTAKALKALKRSSLDWYADLVELTHGQP